MPIKNTEKAKKTALLTGTNLAKSVKNSHKIKPEKIDLSNTQQVAELLGVNPDFLNDSVKNVIFKKEDFLSSYRIAKALSLDENKIIKEMMFLYRYKVTVSRNSAKYQMVIKNKCSHKFNNFRLHPFAIKKFIEKFIEADKLEKKLQINAKITQGKQYEI